jgi:hypothetical protein|tara:strand:+ start:1753 stop:1959 length:207 start_codon:yes stop_codon:yes gene_type:complete
MSRDEALDYNILRTKALEKKISEQDKQLQEFLSETLDVLYTLEEHHEYGETNLGKMIGELINKLQKEL